MTKTTGDTGNDKLKHSIGIINPRHDAIFIASEVKHHSAVLEDACATDRTFYVRWRCPIGTLTCRCQAMIAEWADAQSNAFIARSYRSRPMLHIV
jgi:hypothetical protein